MYQYDFIIYDITNILGVELRSIAQQFKIFRLFYLKIVTPHSTRDYLMTCWQPQYESSICET